MTEEERRLLKLRYVDEMTLQEIADLREKAKSTISRKKKKGKKKILKESTTPPYRGGACD